MAPNKKIRYRLQRIERFFKYRILHTNDSPSCIARGVAVGLFVAWTPAIGLHILMALTLAFIFRANKFAAVACAWVSNPFTLVPIYYPSFLLGKKLLQFFRAHSEMDNTSATELCGRLSITWNFGNVFTLEFWRNMLYFFWHYALPELWLGSIIIGLILAAVGYFVTYKLVVRHRKANPHRRFDQHDQ